MLRGIPSAGPARSPDTLSGSGRARQDALQGRASGLSQLELGFRIPRPGGRVGGRQALGIRPWRFRRFTGPGHPERIRIAGRVPTPPDRKPARDFRRPVRSRNTQASGPVPDLTGSIPGKPGRRATCSPAGSCSTPAISTPRPCRPVSSPMGGSVGPGSCPASPVISQPIALDRRWQPVSLHEESPQPDVAYPAKRHPIRSSFHILMLPSRNRLPASRAKSQADTTMPVDGYRGGGLPSFTPPRERKLLC
jgi:hypothetical protein